MGAFTGTLSYKLFFVQGDLPDDWRDRFLANIRHRRFEPLSPEEEEEEKIGWVPIERPLLDDFHLNTVLYDDFINVGLRTDKYVIPSDLLKAHIAETERDYMAQNDKKKLSKFEREDIKVMVRKRLKEQTLPRMKVIDMSWQLSSMRVRFWSQSSKTCELFQGYFEDTFGLKLIPSNPYTHAVEFGLGEEQIERLAEVEPSNFVEGVAAAEY